MTAVALAPARDKATEAARLYDAHAEWLQRYCLRQLGSRADAEDAVQTTFLYALRALRRGVAPACEEAWLTTIAKNVCHTHRRTAARRPTVSSDDLNGRALTTDDPDEAAFVSELPVALRTLPQNQRAALVLREWHGLEASEIAARLELTTTATHALLTRARRSLASALTASLGRPLAALNGAFALDALRGHVKALLAGGATKVAAGVTVASVVAGGALAGSSPERPAGDPRPSATVQARFAGGLVPSALRPDSEPRAASPARSRNVASPPKAVSETSEYPDVSTPRAAVPGDAAAPPGEALPADAAPARTTEPTADPSELPVLPLPLPLPLPELPDADAALSAVPELPGPPELPVDTSLPPVPAVPVPSAPDPGRLPDVTVPLP